MATADWSAARKMIDLYDSVKELQGTELRNLLHVTTRLFSPLEDPLNCDFTKNAWLRGEREETYSAWLTWVLAQVENWREVAEVLGIEIGDGRKVEVRREECIPYEDCERAGRLDLTIRAEGAALCVVEVKTRVYDQAALEKHKDYCAAPRVKPFLHKRFLAVDCCDDKDLGEFKFVSWADVCLRLRRNALQVQPPLARAMILAFVGAVEQNILGMSAQEPAGLPKTIAHLRRFQEEGRMTGTPRTREEIEFLKEGVRCFLPAMQALKTFSDAVRATMFQVLSVHEKELAGYGFSSRDPQTRPNLDVVHELTTVEWKGGFGSFFIQFNPDHESKHKSLWMAVYFRVTGAVRERLARSLRVQAREEGLEFEEDTKEPVLYVGRYMDYRDHFPDFAPEFNRFIEGLLHLLKAVDFKAQFGASLRR